MPKRSYPFGDATPLQLKKHVGQKELCQGVCGDKYKREVFERTKKLLFRGAQAFMGNAEHQSEPLEKVQEETCNVHDLLNGQTLIGQDGKLLRSSQTQKCELLTCFYLYNLHFSNGRCFLCRKLSP
ncbi:hypothetical protein FKM82_016958 [Ascaphus truei]